MEEGSQGSKAVPQLQYAVRNEAAEMLRVYRLVGWYFLLLSLVSVVTTTSYAFVLPRAGMASWSVVSQLLISLGPMILCGVGAVGMVGSRSWGAWAVITICGMRVLLGGAVIASQFPVAPSSASPGSLSALIGGIGSVLDGLVHALLPWAIWQFCRSRGAWA